MNILNESPPSFSEYFTLNKNSSHQYSRDELIEIIDIVIGTSLATSGGLQIIEVAITQGDPDHVKDLFEAIEQGAAQRGEFNRAVANCMIEKYLWASAQHVRDRIDKLSGGDPEKRDQIADVFAQHFDDLSLSEIMAADQLESFAEMMNKAEAEIENLDI